MANVVARRRRVDRASESADCAGDARAFEQVVQFGLLPASVTGGEKRMCL
jgi:hypothetical protein